MIGDKNAFHDKVLPLFRGFTFDDWGNIIICVR